MRGRGLVAVSLVAFATPLAAERLHEPPAGLAGLVAPAMVADGPPGCLRADTREMPVLRSGPGNDHPRIGSLQFLPWRTDSGECDEVQPHFLETGKSGRRTVPTLERAYEEPALLLLAQQGDWLRINLGEGASGWLRRPTGYVVDEYPALLVDKLAYATGAWRGELCAAAGGACRRIEPGTEPSIRVLSTQVVGATSWLEIELTSPACGDAEPVRLDAGWIRSHDGDGRPTAWFHSRGC